MKYRRVSMLGALLVGIVACPRPSGEADAGVAPPDSGPATDGGLNAVCQEFPTTCEPESDETPMEALDECYVCSRGLCRVSGGEEVCGEYADPHPVFCAGVDTPLQEATPEDGLRPLIVSGSITIAELNRTICQNGFVWTIEILRVPGVSAFAHLAIGEVDPIEVSLSDKGRLIEDGVSRLLDVAGATICLDVDPEANVPFSMQLEDSEGRRSPRYCGQLEIRVGDDSGD